MNNFEITKIAKLEKENSRLHNKYGNELQILMIKNATQEEQLAEQASIVKSSLEIVKENCKIVSKLKEKLHHTGKALADVYRDCSNYKSTLDEIKTLAESEKVEDIGITYLSGYSDCQDELKEILAKREDKE
jgi:chromosome segregation ATPase